jgi:zinc transporter ZupT
LGTIIGGSLAQYNDTLGDVIIAMTSGGFLYISTVGMLPMLSKNDINLIQVLYETIGFVLGVVLMALVAIYE